MNSRLTATLVLYNSRPEVFEPAIDSFLLGSDGTLVVVDNSPTPLSSRFFSHTRVRFVHTGRNVGFGAGHNIGFRLVQSESDFHLILNPDITFGKNVIPHLLHVLRSRQSIGAIMPQIRYPDGALQRLCKLLPTPADLIVRRFLPLPSVTKRWNERYELADLSQVSCSQVPSMSGCFIILRAQLFTQIGGFDERFFMYLEDVDLVRRIGDIAETLFDPSVFVEHAYGKGSYTNWRLLSYHMQSAFKYFNKWGWLRDPVRRRRNLAVLNSILSTKELEQRHSQEPARSSRAMID